MKERTLQWDGKCDQCRKLMSKCVCFQEPADRLAGLPELEIKADQRPLYNALRKMHHRAPAFLAPPPDARRDRTQSSQDRPPRHLPGRQRDPRARLLSSSAAGPPLVPKPGARRPSTADAGNQSRSSSQSRSQSSQSSQSSSASDLKRSSIYAGAPRGQPAYPYSSFDASSLAPGESFDSADSVYEL